MTSRPIIHVQGLTVFHGSRPVLRDMDFVINRGEFTFLTGATGSGKTSLLKTLYADLPLKVGKVEVAGFGLGALKKPELPFLRRKLGIIFQDFQLLTDRDVEENLWFVLKATGWKKKSDEAANNRGTDEGRARLGWQKDGTPAFRRRTATRGDCTRPVE